LFKKTHKGTTIFGYVQKKVYLCTQNLKNAISSQQ
jgi:hypothetical protein